MTEAAAAPTAAKEPILLEDFTAAAVDTRLQWFCPPPSHTLQDGHLLIKTAGETGGQANTQLWECNCAGYLWVRQGTGSSQKSTVDIANGPVLHSPTALQSQAGVL